MTNESSASDTDERFIIGLRTHGALYVLLNSAVRESGENERESPSCLVMLIDGVNVLLCCIKGN